MKVKFTASLVDNNPSYFAKQQRACVILSIVWNSPEFKAEIENNAVQVCSGFWRWKTCKIVNQFSSTSETNAQVYNKLMSNENAYIKQDIVSCSNPKVVGYEDGSDITKVCKGWDEYLDIYGVVNNIAHEYCHTLGYHHSSAKDYNSVPYRVGNIAEEVARRLQLS